MEETATDVYLVQFIGPVMSKWKDAVVQAGGELGDYIPDYTFLVHLPDLDTRSYVESLPFVRWVGPYKSAYKIAFQIESIEAASRGYRVVFASWVDLARVHAHLKTLNLASSDVGREVAVVLNQRQLEEVVRLDDVIWVEPLYRKYAYGVEKINGVSSYVSNGVAVADIVGASQAWSQGYNGDSVIVAVADTGLDTGDSQTVHQDFQGRISQISSWPVTYADYGLGCEIANAGADDGAADVDSGHGTHVAGSVAGDGSQSGGEFKGGGYAANIVFQAVEQYTTWTNSPVPCMDGDGYFITGLPDDARDLLSEAYQYGARIHNDSWGGGAFGEYDSTSQQFDDFVYQHPDMIILVSVGNAGTDADHNGYVDENSITSPATAKNLISVGASENERNAGGYQYSWGYAWPMDYQADPTKSDLISDNREHLAAFSSRGPLEDGRIKPDLVAPGTNILSTRSSQITSNGWGPYNAYYMFMGGTSMASPVATGAAALVYDYYVKGFNYLTPSAALIKATLINTAVDIAGYGYANEEAGLPIPNNHEGWGRINVAEATRFMGRQFVDEVNGVSIDETYTYDYSVGWGSDRPFKTTLVWSDYPASPMASKALVNDLNLHIIAPDGTEYWGNHFSDGWSQSHGTPDTINNVENVYIAHPVSGQWRIEVLGKNIPYGPQPFALVVDGLSETDALTVTSITPSSAWNDSITSIVVAGHGFKDTSRLHLLASDDGHIPASEVITASVLSVNQNTLTAILDLEGVFPGSWDVRVTNSNTQTAILSQGFVVKDATLPDLSISKTPHQSVIFPGSWLTYTIAIKNHSPAIATHVVFTETLPDSAIFVDMVPTCAYDTIVLPRGFVCQVPNASTILGLGVTYTLVVSVPFEVRGVLTNNVTLSSFEADADTLNNYAQALVEVQSARYRIYLPLLLKDWSVVSPPPSLYPIDNMDEDGTYVLQWSPPSHNSPDAYDIEENGALMVQAYGGISYEILDKATGVYTYRVRGVYNDYGYSTWSNPQQVVVSVSHPISNPVRNGDFENGADGAWVEYSANGYDLIVDSFTPILVHPHNGDWAAWLGGAANEVSSISQQIAVPVDQSQLSFWYLLASVDDCGKDFGYVFIDDTLIETFDLCSSQNRIEWVKYTISLSDYVAQWVKLQIRVETDGDANSNFFVDDVFLE